MLYPEKIDVKEECWDRLFAPSSCLAMITTIDALGSPNAAPFGTCTRVCHDPVYIAFTVGAGKDTYRNILEVGSFVANLASFELGQLAKIVAAGQAFEHGTNELEKVGLTAMSARCVSPPRIAEFGRHFECEVEWTKHWVNRLMVVGRVVAASCTKGLVDETGYLKWKQARPAHYCGSAYHSRFVAAYEVVDLDV